VCAILKYQQTTEMTEN